MPGTKKIQVSSWDNFRPLRNSMRKINTSIFNINILEHLNVLNNNKIFATFLFTFLLSDINYPNSFLRVLYSPILINPCYFSVLFPCFWNFLGSVPFLPIQTVEQQQLNWTHWKRLASQVLWHADVTPAWLTGVHTGKQGLVEQVYLLHWTQMLFQCLFDIF